MKKKKLILIILIILIAVIIGGFVSKKDNLGYEVEKISKYEYFVLKIDGKFGVIDNKGNVVVDAKYDNVIIPNPMKDLFVCGDIVLNKENKEIFNNYDINVIKLENIATPFMYEKSCLVYSEDAKFGLINFEGKKLTKPIFDSIETLKYKEGEMLVTENGKKGVINLNGKYIVKPEYDSIEIDKMYKKENQYKEAGYIVAIKADDGYRYGYVDNFGNEIVECKNNELSRITNIDSKIKDTYLIAAENGLFGVYKNEEKIINNEYNSIRYDQLDNIYIVEKAKKFGVLDSTGKQIVKIKYAQIDVNGIYVYAKDNSGDIIDIYNKQGVKQSVDLAGYTILETPVSNCYIRIDQNQSKGYELVDRNHNPITRIKYMYIEHLKGEYFIANNGKIGVIDKKANVIIENKYDSIEDVKNVLFAIDSNKKTTIYSSKMKEILTMENMNYVEEENYIKLYNSTETIYLDKDGNILKNIDIISANAYAKKEENGTYTLISKNGNQIGNASYEKVSDSNVYGFMGYKKDGLWGAMDNNGKVLSEPIYNIQGNIEPSFVGKYIMIEYGFGEIYCTNK